MSDDDSQKMGFNATWSMAVGGMIGGGIFSVLGVVVSAAGAWAWLSFVLAGFIALLTGYSYVVLVDKLGEGGGAFTFLRHEHHERFAGGLSWVLIFGYVLTLSVYAFTFGHYLANVLDLGGLTARIAAASVIVVLVGVNLFGVGGASWTEIVTVWGKLAVLVALAAVGLWRFDAQAIHYDQAAPGGLGGAVIGAATIFMAYEGFQLLAYDYDDIRAPKRTLRRAVLSAIVCVISVYIVVTLAAASLVGADKLVEHKEVALAMAGEEAAGLAGKIAVTVAAAFSTASAINATLFATARLTQKVADDGELPAFFKRDNKAGVPDRAILLLGGIGLTLAVVGNLSQLVEAASLTFLFTFATVNVLAWREKAGISWLHGLGAVLAGAAAVTLVVRLAMHQPIALGVLGAVIVAAVVGQPILHRSRG